MPADVQDTIVEVHTEPFAQSTLPNVQRDLSTLDCCLGSIGAKMGVCS